MTTAVVDQTKDQSDLASWFQPWPAAGSFLAKRKVTDQMLGETSLVLIPTLPSASCLFRFLFRFCFLEDDIFLASFSQKIVQKASTN